MAQQPTAFSANYWYKVKSHYENYLTERFMYEPLTPATQYRMRAALAEESARQRHRETHPVWHVPLTLRFDLATHSVVVEPEETTPQRTGG